jgi:hypothetical protein
VGAERFQCVNGDLGHHNCPTISTLDIRPYRVDEKAVLLFRTPVTHGVKKFPRRGTYIAITKVVLTPTGRSRPVLWGGEKNATSGDALSLLK